MSATSKLRPRNASETDGRPVLRPAGNTATIPRKAFTPPSKPASPKVPVSSVKNNPKLPSPILKTSSPKPSLKQPPESPKSSVSDGLSEDGERASESRRLEEACNAGFKKAAVAAASRTALWKSNTVTKAYGNGVAKSLGNIGRKSPVNSISLGSSSLEEASVSLPSTPTVSKKEVRAMDMQMQRRVKVSSGYGRKQGNQKAGRIVPDGLLPDMSPPGDMKKRCGWITPQSDPASVAYHDTEWGVPIHDDRLLFEMLVLVGAQAELSWPTILSKRVTFRTAFAGFEPAVVAKFDAKKVASLKSESSIMQHEGKIRGIIENANQVLQIVKEFGSFDKYLWGFVNHKPIISKNRFAKQVPVKSPKSELISKDMMKRGFRFVGPTIMYSFMQTVGMTNDHLVTCFRYDECNKLLEPQQVEKCINQQVEELSAEEEEIFNVASLYPD